MTTAQRSVELTAEEYRTAWQHLDLGDRHWNLPTPSLGEETFEQRAGARTRAWEALRARRLTDRHDLAPELADGLRLIARPSAELNARLQLPDGDRRAVVSARGERAVAATIDDAGHLQLRWNRSSSFTSVAAELVPATQPAPGTAVSVPAALLNADKGLSGPEVERRLAKGGVRGNDARNFRQLIAGPKRAGAKYGAARYDRNHRRVIADFVITWFETERGAITIEQKRGADRQPWFTVAPADHARLADRLGTLLDSIRVH